MNLYELTTEAAKLAAILDSDELSEEMRAEAEELQHIMLNGLLVDKVESYCHVIAQMDADAKTLRAEEKRLAERRKVRENAVARMKDALHDALLAADTKKLDVGKWTVAVNKSPAKLAVVAEDMIPDDYRIPQPAKLDRKALLDALKDGAEIAGVTMEQGTHLRIR